jgi:large subunit ribosomal protein L29
MKIKEIVAKKDAELQKELKILTDKLLKVKFEVATKETNQHTDVKKLKTDIARINTILREREIQREEEKNEKNA